MVNISLPAAPIPLTLMSIHVLLTLCIIILFHSADLVSTSILNVSTQLRENQALRPYRAAAVLTLMSSSDNLRVWVQAADSFPTALTTKGICHLMMAVVGLWNETRRT